MDAHRTRARREESEQERDERALPSAVGSGQAEHLARQDLERQVVEREDFTSRPAPVALADAIEMDQRGAMGWAAFGAVPYGDMPGGIVPTGTVPGVGAQLAHGPAPAR